MALDPATELISLGHGLIDKIWPDPVEAAKAKLAMAQADANGELEKLKVGISVMVAEAQSGDKWTSRARPSFLYVVYVMLLMGIPMGFISAWKPEVGIAVATGFKAWLSAIPDTLYYMFGTVMTGYGIQRTVEKVKGAA
jgi:hypothetical protein